MIVLHSAVVQQQKRAIVQLPLHLTVRVLIEDNEVLSVADFGVVYHCH